MKMARSLETLNVYLITDNTYSMKEACNASRQASPEVVAIGNLVTGRDCVTMGVIGDYDSATPNHAIGGFSLLRPGQPESLKTGWLDKYLHPCGGGGEPEAYKTALNFLLRELPGIVFLFLDALPHGVEGQALDIQGQLEEKFLQKNNMITDWERLTTTFKAAGFQTVTFVTGNIFTKFPHQRRVYAQLGYVIDVKENKSNIISAVMLQTLFGLLGQSRPSTPVAEKALTYHCWDADGKTTATTQLLEPYCFVDLKARVFLVDPNLVFTIFDKLLDPKQPNQAMCLTTNPIIGKYWRLVCGPYRTKEDGKYELRCQGIMNKLSQVVNNITNMNDKTYIQTWICASHDDAALVRDIVGKSLQEEGGGGHIPNNGVFMLPNDVKFNLSRDDVLELGRGGDFQQLAKVIAEIQLSFDDVDKNQLDDQEESCPNFIPCANIAPIDVMRLIGNLLSPKLVFSKTVAMFAAILSLTNKYLSALALSTLQANVGKWIDWSLDSENKQNAPVFWSYNFMKLLKLAPNEVLTQSEIKFRDHYHLISHLTKLQDARITLTVPVILNESRKDVTWKRYCGGCQSQRCFTIFPGDSDICGVCIALNPQSDQYNTNVGISKQYGHSMNPSNYEEPSENETNWVQCHTCHSNYGIIDVANLKVRPKCHPCRMHEIPETVTCEWCLHKYLSPEGSAMIAMREATACVKKNNDDDNKLLEDVVRRDAFVCPRCILHRSSMTSEVVVKLCDLILENPELKTMIPIDNYDAVMDQKTKFWRRVLQSQTITEEMDEKKHYYSPSSLLFQGFTVHNADSSLAVFRDMLYNTSGEHTQTICNMCFDEVPVRSMELCCGKCTNTMCRKCIVAWYGHPVVGRLISENHTKCPFCKSPPKFKIVKHFSLSQVRNIRPKKNRAQEDMCTWDPHSLYAICIDCLCAKPALPRICVDANEDNLIEINNFHCDDCITRGNIARGTSALQQAEDVPLTKNCPSCNAATAKVGGCNHITCANCQSHWCWSCAQNKEGPHGTAFTQYSIYGHMSKCGGIWPHENNNFIQQVMTDEEEEEEEDD